MTTVGTAAPLRVRLSRIAGPAAMTVVMLAILISLGVWQIHRLHWKRGILAAIDDAEQTAPIPLPAAPSPFAKVEVTGTYEPGSAARYGADVRDTRAGPTLGEQALGVLRRPGAPPLLVDRGWAPDTAQPPLPAGEQHLVGYVRGADRPGWFSATDDRTGRRFYTLDPAAIGPALGAPDLAPYTLVLLGRPAPGVWPSPAEHLPRPPNDHLNYALTWFGLAAILAVVFILYARKALRA